VNSSLRNQ